MLAYVQVTPCPEAAMVAEVIPGQAVGATPLMLAGILVVEAVQLDVVVETTKLVGQETLTSTEAEAVAGLTQIVPPVAVEASTLTKKT